jgi:hypothetical protein
MALKVMGSVRRLAAELWGSAPPDSIDEHLWNDHISASQYNEDDARYLGAILEQYKLCVEMADRVSARRAVANTFFLTLNTAILTAIGVFLKEPHGSSWSLLVPLVVLLGECLTWFWVVRSYRQLNGAKYVVIGALERRLPASPYWRAEWRALGEGRDRAKYWPLTHIEQGVPVLFAVAYLGGFALLVA